MADQARRLGVNISAAARDGVAAAVRAALVRADRTAYQNCPEKVDRFCAEGRGLGRRVESRRSFGFAEGGRKRRPVLVLTRSEVLDVRALVTVAAISTSTRVLAAEVQFDHVAAGLDLESVINCDGLHTLAQTMLTTRVGEVDGSTLEQVCVAIHYALGC